MTPKSKWGASDINPVLCPYGNCICNALSLIKIFKKFHWEIGQTSTLPKIFSAIQMSFRRQSMSKVALLQSTSNKNTNFLLITMITDKRKLWRCIISILNKSICHNQIGLQVESYLTFQREFVFNRWRSHFTCLKVSWLCCSVHRSWILICTLSLPSKVHGRQLLAKFSLVSPWLGFSCALRLNY